MSFTWRKFGKVATRVVGTAAGAVIGTVAGGQTLAGAGLGYAAGAAFDPVLGIDTKRSVDTSLQPFNPMAAYTYGTPRSEARNVYKNVEDKDKVFDTTMGVLDTASSLVSLIPSGGTSLFSGGSGIVKAANTASGVAKTAGTTAKAGADVAGAVAKSAAKTGSGAFGKLFTGKNMAKLGLKTLETIPQFIDKKDRDKDNPIIDNDYMKQIGAFINTAAPGQYGNLKTKLNAFDQFPDNMFKY